jgi:ribosome maturation factor RimP
MTQMLQQIEAIAGPIIEKHGAFLTELVLRGELRSKVLEVYVDTDAGITIDVCTTVSRELSEALDAQDIIPGAYRLDVSSPDLSRPIRVLRQYKKNTGRVLSVTFVDGGTELTIEGKAEAADEAGLTIRPAAAAEARTIPMAAIQQAFIVPQMKKK